MGGSGAPPVSIPLRDGTQLSVTPAGIQLGTQFFELSRIHDARQVSPDPETFALRVAGAGLVEFQPARPGDGSIALAALFRFRPDLRPAGFVGPPEGADFPSPQPPVFPYPPALGYPPPFAPPPAYGPPPGGYPPPPGYGYMPPVPPRAMYYGPSPNAQQGELTPYPRTFGELLGAIFQLYGKHFRKWLTLGILVAIVPAFLSGVLQVAIYLAFGLNPWGSSADLFPASAFSTTQPSTVPTLPFHFPGPDQLAVIAIVAAAAIILSLFFGAWQAASFAVGARAAILRREVRIGDSLADGLKRLFPVLGTNILLGLINLACFIPVFAPIAVIPLVANSPSSVALMILIALLLFIPSGILALFFGIRLGFAPYVAASDRMGPGTSLASSWRFSRGMWWRTFGIILILAIIVGIATFVVSQVQVVSIAVAVLVATPLLAAFTAPLFALGWMIMWYDLRLRREGYAAVTQTAPVPAGAPSPSFGPPYGPPPAQG